MDELDGLAAARLRDLLEAQGRRREDVAQKMAVLGFRWTGNTASQVINGRRGLSLFELAGLCEALEIPLLELLGADGAVTSPDGSRSVTVPQIVDAIDTGGGDWQARATVRALFRQELDEATAKVSRRLGVEPKDVDEAAMSLWGRPLAVERDHRIQSDDLDLNAPENRRTLQARRGHATRALIDELRAHLEQRSEQ